MEKSGDVSFSVTFHISYPQTYSMDAAEINIIKMVQFLTIEFVYKAV